MKDLSGKQRIVLETIVKLKDEKGYPPTVREIGSCLGYKSSSTTHGMLAKLEKKGYIRREPSISRAIEIIKQ